MLYLVVSAWFMLSKDTNLVARPVSITVDTKSRISHYTQTKKERNPFCKLAQTPQVRTSESHLDAIFQQPCFDKQTNFSLNLCLAYT